MEQILSCPVCGAPLSLIERSYRCPSGHNFDIAKQGYVNLLPAKGGTVHGDNALMIGARARFLARGYYTPLAEAFSEAVAKHAQSGCVFLDVGCGEGYYTEWAAKALAEKAAQILAFDISKDAVKATAKRRLGATLFAASAYAVPVLSERVDIASLLFSPFCKEELARVLKKDGILIMAYPGKKHLWGLKCAVYDTPYENKPEDTAIEGFTLLEERVITDVITLGSGDEIMDLFAMTPYYYKTGEGDKEKLATRSSLITEIEFHLCIYQKNYNTQQK